jgi:mRNA interferase HicA
MKRRDLIRHLERHGCRLLREGNSHSIFENSANRLRTAVARHREIPEPMVRVICKQLSVPAPDRG